MNESRNGMRSSLIAALLVGLLLFPAILPAGDAPVMRAENLGDKTLFTEPLLLAVANLDQRISTATDTASRARLTHQRALMLERLTRTILFRGGNGFAATLPADELARLRDIVSSARRSGDKTAEMTAILRLNNAILDQSFSDLLATVARDWIKFAPASDFNRAFNSFEKRTAFNQVPFGRAVQHLHGAGSTTLSAAEQALIDAYRDYSQRAEVYHAVAQSLFGFVKGATTSYRLLHWLGISALIGAVDAQPWAIDINARMLPGSQYSIGQFVSIGQFFAAALLFLALTGVGLILLPMLSRLVRRALPKRGQSAQADPSESERFVRLLEQSFYGPLRVLLQKEQADLTAADARRADFESRLATLEQLVEQLDADYQDARETLESGEVNDDLGRILMQQFDALPDLRAFTQNDELRKTDIADLNVRRLEHRAEARSKRKPKSRGARGDG